MASKDAGIIIKGLERLLTYMSGFDWVCAERFHMEAAAYVKAQILMRTRAGIDADEHDFTPYSSYWKRVRDRVGLPTDRVDLFFTGSMLASMTWKANKDRAVVFFRPSKDRFGSSNPEKAFYNHTKVGPRKFFAMSESDIRELVSIYWKILKKQWRK